MIAQALVSLILKQYLTFPQCIPSHFLCLNTSWKLSSQEEYLFLPYRFLHTFPLPWYFMEIKFSRRVLVSVLSLFAKRFSILARNSLVLVISFETVPLKTLGMPHLMIIRLMRFEWSHFSWSFLYLEVLESVGEGGFLNS